MLLEVPIEAGIAGTVSLVRPEHRGLAFHADDRPVDERPAERDADPVQLETGLEIVRAVHDEIHAAHGVDEILAGEPLRAGHDVDLGIERGEGLPRRLGLGEAHAGAAMQDLTVEIGHVHAVRVHQHELPDPGTGEIRRHR